ncbi:Succinyl-CoA ligase [ADP-forming] subunit beta [Candidatus Providencia siddallii]|uniref:Succinate--CoA ligase [ADP-forming] subunit beta n=1 Tax=Candidatus Providencia siddallii TaxID=1715285 RepID=A0A0M6W7W9_9GAMM|nr:Succinyl-CoA ligase [ADP-forming] subunit beta [Candidatus Providencia siddallii]
MNLHEYQAKRLINRYGIPVPVGYVCSTVDEIMEVAKNNKGPWVIKCQIHAGGRGKAGGVKIIDNVYKLKTFAEKWLGKKLVTYQTDESGQLINKILVEVATDIVKELYFGAVIDRSNNRVVFMVSTEGGIEIEEVAKKTPELIHKVIIDPLTGPMFFQGRELAFKLGLMGKQVIQFTNIFMALAKLFFDCDLLLAEINPLVINMSDDLICLDCKLDVDKNSLYRQPELYKMYDRSQEDVRETQANKHELNYVSLNGDIGCMVNGAGLAMGTMDIVKLYGGLPANFLDVGGSVTKDRVIEAFKIIISDKNVKVIFVNIFGGIVRCDLIANGIVDAIKKININIPVVVRLEGNNADFGIKKLTNSGLNIIVTNSLVEAAKKAISVSMESK